VVDVNTMKSVILEMVGEAFMGIKLCFVVAVF
jgi:hypothetical protein